MTVAERVEHGIDDPARVSSQQRDAIRADGNFFLHSRPGSGKTRTAGIRVARLVTGNSGARVAATSYTNIAIEQIRDTVREWGVVLGSQHFAETLHRFLLRYVLYPFGHLDPVGLAQPFRLVGDAEWSRWPAVIYQGDQKKRLPVGMLHYAADGGFHLFADPRIGVSREEAESAEAAQVRQRKKESRASGLASLSDAMFYAQKLLETYPAIAKAVAERFDELIVDEAQDTSDVQMRCLELLHGTGGLKSLVLIGDVDQSIYSFQGARPEHLEQLARDCDLAELRLTENFRSSQAICDVTCRFCGRDAPDVAVGPNRDAGLSPEILFYDPSSPGTAVELFASRLDELGVAKSKAVVLVRAHRFQDEVNGRPDSRDVGPVVASLGRLAASFRDRRTIERDEVRSVERFLSDMAWGSPSEPDPDMAHAVRGAVMTLLETLPAMDDGTLAEWIEGAREAVKNVLPTLTEEPVRKPSNLIRKKAGDEDIPARDVFSTEPRPLWARTVHDAKGESHEAVLLVVEPPRRGRRPQAELWATPLIGEPVEADEAEELRIAYVALTRAERYCAVAVPADTDGAALQPYLDVGFALND